MLVPLVRIGNSKGIRIPKAIIKQTGLTDEIDLEVKDGKVILSPAKQVRADWATAAEACHKAGDDEMDDWDATLNDFEGSWS